MRQDQVSAVQLVRLEALHSLVMTSHWTRWKKPVSRRLGESGLGNTMVGSSFASAGDAPWWRSISDFPLEGPKRTYSASRAEVVLWKKRCGVDQTAAEVSARV